MFQHCALRWCQCVHIVRWDGVNVSTLWAEMASMFPQCELSLRQCFHIVQCYRAITSNIYQFPYKIVQIITIFVWKHWHQLSPQCGNIDANSAQDVETLTQTQLTMWKHWCHLSIECGNIDTNSAHNVETLTWFQARAAILFNIISFFLANQAQYQNFGYVWVLKGPCCQKYQKICDHCWVPLTI